MARKFIKKLVKKIINFISNKDSNNIGKINIDKSVRIYPNVILNTEYGGSITVGINTEILYGVIIMTYGGTINIGENCSINPYSILYGHGNLTIGNNVLIAGHCMIIPANHKFDNLSIPINKQGEIRKGIIIEDNVWIGSGCKILDGVTISSGSIIAAGSVVTKNVPVNCVYGGIPAKLIKIRS